MMNAKPVASLSIDLDNQWSYMKTHGDEGWELYPSYLDLVVPRVFEVMARHNLRITFFIVGQDAALEKNRNALSRICPAGHEVGNHSFHHEPWLHLYTDEQVQEEIEAAENAIFSATGARPKGFRGPGFSVSLAVLETLKQRGYLYDASTFPTLIGPVARAYYFFKSDLDPKEKQKRNALFGGISDGFRPLKPYVWNLRAGPLVELPVTTMPGFRVPFHVSYLLYLLTFSSTLAKSYFSMSLRLCRLSGVQPSLLLHPLDFLGNDDIDALAFFPGMGLPSKKKLALIDSIFEEFKRHFDVLPMSEHVISIQQNTDLRSLEPKFHDLALV